MKRRSALCVLALAIGILALFWPVGLLGIDAPVDPDADPLDAVAPTT
jgi:hypothetical protein